MRKFHSDRDRNFDDLVGYQNGNGKATSNEDDFHNHQDTAEGLLDPEDFDEAAQAQTPQRSQLWAKNPFAKLGMIGGGTAMVFLLLGVVFTSIFSDSNQPVADRPVIGEPEESDEPEETEAISEEGQLKTALALSRQADQMEEIEAQEPSKALPEPEPVRKPPLARPLPRPLPRIEPPRRERPEPRRVAARPSPRVVPTIKAAPTLPPKPVVPEPPKVDPATEWERLAKVGSYGQVTSVSNKASRNTTGGRSKGSGARASRPQVDRREETPVLTGRRGREIAIGTTAQGILETPIVWEGEVQQQDKFIVRLDEPVVGANGKVILPPGTQLLTEVPAISGSGLVQMSAVAAIVERDGQKTEVSLPAGGIQIRGEGGSALLAEKYFDSGSDIASLDAGLALLAGIGQAAELINRPERKVVVTDDGIVSAAENPDPDLIAGFLEGGADVLVPQLSARNQRAINEALQRSNFWSVDAGTPVQVFVNKEIRI